MIYHKSCEPFWDQKDSMNVKALTLQQHAGTVNSCWSRCYTRCEHNAETWMWTRSCLKPPDSDQAMEVCYNAVSGSLSIVPGGSVDPLTAGPKETDSPCFLVFDGIGLTEDGLKDWLRLCAKQVGNFKSSSAFDRGSHWNLCWAYIMLC